VGEVVVDPGRYLLRLAAVDASGRRGSVEHAAKAALVSASGLEISDLVLGPARPGSGLRPTADLERAGGGLEGLVELGARDRSRLQAATVAFELADSADGPALLRVPVEASPPGSDGARVAKVSMAAGLLPPGSYSRRVVVSLKDEAVAAVTRPCRVGPRQGTQESSVTSLASLLLRRTCGGSRSTPAASRRRRSPS
jgi:hypothetical protein